MTPKFPALIATAGPLKGRSFPLGENELSIGRESANLIAIHDGSLSRRHCLITWTGEHYELSDLDSLNGTFVNEVPANRRRLSHGDCIRLGTSHFLFLQRENEPGEPFPEVYFDERALAAGNTVELRAEDIFRELARDLHALMKIARTINSLRGAEDIKRQLLELIFEVVPAERGAVLMASGDREDEFEGGDNASFYVRRGEGGEEIAPPPPFRVSRTIIRRVLREGVLLLSNDLTADDDLRVVESLQTAAICSLLCVPLTVRGRALGVVYLASRDPAARFTPDQLPLVAAIANVAAVALENAHHLAWLEGENERLRSDALAERHMIGESSRMKEIYQLIARVAVSDSTVLIRGESGTGKELVARAIHLTSSRRDRPFIAINCAALTETLLESEFFGHEKGAFTGAVARKQGKLEAGEGGTIFLDEVGEMPPALQAKLLRALQEREFERVGGTRSIKINVRVLAATNRNLEEAVKSGEFRADLYYRLNVVSLHVPALRERREDIPLLTTYFAAKHAAKCGRKLRGVSPAARSLLSNYDWPGNVRELENAVERAVVLGSSDLLRPEDLPETVLEAAEANPASESPLASRYHDAVKEVKKSLILKALAEAGGVYTEAAKSLGVHPNYLHRLVRNLRLRQKP